MNLQQLKESINENKIPNNLSVYLKALWYDAKGDWPAAHNLVDHLSDKNACRVHAYLHRVEGDKWNANYWYTKCGEPMPDISLEEERTLLVQRLLAHG